MAIRLAELAVRYGCELHGDPDQEISTVGTLESAGPGALSFLANPLYRKYLQSTSATAVVLTAEAVADCRVNGLVAADPYAVYAAIASELRLSQGYIANTLSHISEKLGYEKDQGVNPRVAMSRKFYLEFVRKQAG